MAKQRDTKAEYARRKSRKMAAEKAAQEPSPEPSKRDDPLVTSQLIILERRTKSNPTDADGDIDFAYRNMAMPTVMPLDAPSLAAWEWYLYARSEPNKFLEICAKREDAKAKQAGTITNQRMEDDKRQQFAILDRIEKQLTIDVKGMVKDLMDKFPREVLRECRKYKEAWDSFHEEECK